MNRCTIYWTKLRLSKWVFRLQCLMKVWFSQWKQNKYEKVKWDLRSISFRSRINFFLLQVLFFFHFFLTFGVKKYLNVSFIQGRHGGLGMFGIDIIGLKEMDPYKHCNVLSWHDFLRFLKYISKIERLLILALSKI